MRPLWRLIQRVRARLAERRQLKDEQRLEDDFGDFPGADDQGGRVGD